MRCSEAISIALFSAAFLCVLSTERAKADRAVSLLGREPVSSQTTRTTLTEAVFGAEELEEASRGFAAESPFEQPAPITFPSPPWMTRLELDQGGWLEMGYTMNAHGRGDGFNGPVILNDEADAHQLNQLWYYLERPVETSRGEWAIGGRFDLVYGTDPHYIQSPGLEEQINSCDTPLALALPQFFFEVGIGDLSVKMGRYGYLLAYESGLPTRDFFYSHSLSLYSSEVFFVVGLLGEWRVTDSLTLEAGFHRGFNMFEDINNDLDVVAGVVWGSESGETELSWKMSAGPTDPAGDQNQLLYGLALQRDCSDALQLVTVHYFGCEQKTGQGSRDAQWYGLTQYFLYEIDTRWSAGLRAEWFRDDDGAGIIGLGNVCPGRGWAGGPGFIGDFTNLTLGLHYKPHPNVKLRPEIRWDWYTGRPDRDGELPFDGGDSAHQFLLAVDLVVTY